MLAAHMYPTTFCALNFLKYFAREISDFGPGLETRVMYANGIHSEVYNIDVLYVITCSFVHAALDDGLGSLCHYPSVADARLRTHRHDQHVSH